jgi:hypothetical protein
LPERRRNPAERSCGCGVKRNGVEIGFRMLKSALPDGSLVFGKRNQRANG